MQNIAMKAEPLHARKTADWTMLRNNPLSPFLEGTLPLNANDNLKSTGKKFYFISFDVTE